MFVTGDSLSGLPSGCSGTAPTVAPTMYDTAYDSITQRGNAVLQTTPSGTTCTLYDKLGNPYFTKAPHSPAATIGTGAGTNYSQPSGISANGDTVHMVTMAYDSLFIPQSFSGPNGTAASADHDPWGRVTDSLSTDGAKTIYTYSAGALPATQLAVTGIDNGAGGVSSATWTQTILDGLGRPIKVQSGSGSTPGTVVTETDATYGPCACSPAGKMYSVTQPFAPGGAVYSTNYAYDAIGRTVTVKVDDDQSPSSPNTTTYSYQGDNDYGDRRGGETEDDGCGRPGQHGTG